MIPRRRALDERTPPYGRFGRFAERLALLKLSCLAPLDTCNWELVIAQVPAAL